MRRKPASYRYVEAQLYGYHQLKREVELERERILESGVLLEVAVLGVRVQSSNNYDTTEAKGIELADSKWLVRAMEDLKAIDAVLARIDPALQKLVDLTYWDRRFTPLGISRQLHMSKRTYFRLKDYVVLSVAREMGVAKHNCG